MLKNLIPQLLSNGDGKMPYIQDPMRAAVIMLCVCKQHCIKLNESELHRLCIALCLPKQPRDAFLQYWADFSRDISILKT